MERLQLLAGKAVDADLLLVAFRCTSRILEARQRQPRHIHHDIVLGGNDLGDVNAVRILFIADPGKAVDDQAGICGLQVDAALDIRRIYQRFVALHINIDVIVDHLRGLGQPVGARQRVFARHQRLKACGLHHLAYAVIFGGHINMFPAYRTGAELSHPENHRLTKKRHQRLAGIAGRSIAGGDNHTGRHGITFHKLIFA